MTITRDTPTRPETARAYTERMVEKTVLLADISPHPDNPKIHPDTQIQQLAVSHSTLGQFEPVILWSQPNGKYIQVKGHGYAEGVKVTQDEAVKAWILPEDTPPAFVRQIMLASNLHALNSFDDEAILTRLLQEQKDLGIDLAALGTDEESLRQMLEAQENAYGGEEDTQEETDAPEPEEAQTRVRPGDVWALGRHKIACINSCDPEQVKHLFHDAIPHMVWSDPPYGIEIVATNGYVGGGEAYDIPFGGVKMRGDVGGGASHIRRTGMSYLEASKKGLRGSVGASKPFGSKDVRGTDGTSNIVEVGKYFPVIGDDSTATALAAYRICVEFFPLAVQIWWGANYYANALPPSSCWIVWDKENTGNFADAELAWCNHKSPVRIFKHMWNGMLKDSEHGQRRVHPTQKPIALAQWCFEKYGMERDVIFDPFLGSGISVIAAENLGRTVIGCELSPAYIDVVIKRWEQLTGDTARLLERSEEAAHA